MIKPRGTFDYKILDVDGTVLETGFVRNGVTTVGLTSLLEAWDDTTRYVGLIDSTSFEEVATSDTMSSHAGWVELTDYSEAVRQTLTLSAPASAAVQTSANCVFTMNATVTVKGMFINTVSTKGGTTGTLWCTAIFDTARAFISGQVLQVSYTLEGSGA
jgi:Rad3-related DNA helicase